MNQTRELYQNPPGVTHPASCACRSPLPLRWEKCQNALISYFYGQNIVMFATNLYDQMYKIVLLHKRIDHA